MPSDHQSEHNPYGLFKSISGARYSAFAENEF